MNNQALEAACSELAKALADVLKAVIEATPTSSTRLYSYDDLAEMLGKSEGTIRQWVRAGEFGEPIKAGSSTRVTQYGLDKYIRDHSDPTKKAPCRIRKRPAQMAKVNPRGQPLGI